jgi:hypothetical protein
MTNMEVKMHDFIKADEFKRDEWVVTYATCFSDDEQKNCISSTV